MLPFPPSHKAWAAQLPACNGSGLAYTLVFGSLLLSGGASCDKFGARRVFFMGIMLFSLSSSVCAFAPSLIVLNVARLVQGLGAALLVPSILTEIRGWYPDAGSRGRAIALYAASGGLAQVIGPVLGGVFIAAFGWRAIFLVNIPIGVGVFLNMMRCQRRSYERKEASFNLISQALAIGWISLLAIGFVNAGRYGWCSPKSFFPLGGALIALFLFLEGERRSRSPLLPLEEFKRRSVFLPLIMALLLGFAYFGQFFVLALYLQESLHISALETGLIFLPMTIGVTAANFLVGSKVATIGPANFAYACLCGHNRRGIVGRLLVQIFRCNFIRWVPCK